MLLRSYVRLLAAFDRRELAVGVGALCLAPENANALGQLEVLAVLAVTRAGGTRAISDADWRRIVADPILGELEHEAAQPFGNPYVEELPFIGGVYRTMPGPSGDTRYQMQRILAALFGPQPIGTDEDHAVGSAIALAGLRLGDEVVRAAGHTRQTQVPMAEGEIHIPEAHRFARLKAAVAFLPGRLQQALRGIDSGILAPIQREPMPLPKAIDEDAIERLRQWPLLDAGDRHVVVLPHALLGALARALVDLALRRGNGAAFATRFAETVAGDVDDMMWRRLHLHEAALAVPSTAQLASRVYALDRDALLHVMIATDDLDHYGLLPAYGTWHPNVQASVDARTLAVEEVAFSAADSPNEVVHVLVAQPAGRGIEVVLDPSIPPVFSHRVLMFASEFDIFTRLERVDAQTLRQFAVAANEVREHVVILRRSFLDEFHLYRAHKDSYYMDDDRRYDTVAIDAGGAEVLRTEVQQREDRHGAVDWEDRVVEVVSSHLDPGIPIYRAVNRSPCLLIEGPDLPVWIDLAMPPTPEYASIVRSIGDTIAYWLWQCVNDLASLLGEIRARRPVLRIGLEVVAGPGWGGEPAASDGDGYTCVVDEHGFTLRVDDGAVALMHRGDNTLDRDLVTRLLRYLVEYANGLGIDANALLDAGVVRERVAPLGMKKHLLVHPQLDPQHHPGALPRMRRVQDAHEATALDLVGAAASAKFAECDLTSSTERVRVLNASVDVLMKAIEDRVAKLAPEGLLEDLVVRVERLIYEREHARIVVPTRIACYGGGSNYALEVQRQWQDTVIAAVATRFLVEYVVARPGSGLRSPSTYLIDELVALAAILINLGKRSDVLHQGLGEVPMRLLPSGRLGFRDDEYNKGTARYVGVANAEQMERAVEDLAGRWSKGNDAGAGFLTELDGPAVPEFGCSLTDLLGFFAEWVNAGHARAGEAKAERLDVLVPEFAAAMPWAEDRVRDVIDRFSLGPRERFVPAGKDGWQVYPWRYQRRYSYLRRPFLIREREGVREVVWGIRHVLDTGYLITGDLRDGRYQSETPELAAAIGRLRERAGKAFAERVGRVFGSHERFTVGTNQKRFRGVVARRENGADLGDFDVLVADRARRRLRALEAKNLALARTVVEEQHLLESIFVGTNAKRSDAAKHRTRCEWLAEHVDLALVQLGIEGEDASAWTVEGLIVLSEASSAPFVARSLLPVYSVRELQNDPDAAGEVFMTERAPQAHTEHS